MCCTNESPSASVPVHKLHLANASARRIGFEAPQAISGAMIQAESAVDAAGVIFVTGFVRAVKAARPTPGSCRAFSTRSDPSRESARDSRPRAGSKTFFTRDISSRSSRRRSPN